MKYVLYDILLHISLVILSPYFILKMITAQKYREGLPERFGFIGREKIKKLSGGRVIWFHAVSVGETKAAAPLLRLFKERHPSAKVVFSTVTTTGNRTAGNDLRGLIDALIYFPLDLPWAVKRTVRQLKPSVFVTVEKEIWPNAFSCLNSSSVPVIVVNGTISERSFRRFLRYGFFFKDIFGMISFFCARTDEDRGRAVEAGVGKDRASTTGNIKFDISPPAVEGASLIALRKALGIAAGDNVLVAGSTHPGEEEILLEVFKGLSGEIKGLKLILAPRHPERFSEVEALLKKSGLSYSRRTGGGTKEKAEAVLLDTVGELMTVYSFSTVAFVGGSLAEGVGGHNLLEPAFFGKPVVYGSRLTTYLNMAEMLEGAGGALRADSSKALYEALKRLFTDEALRVRMGDSARKCVEANRGAAKRTVDVIDRFFTERQI